MLPAYTPRDPGEAVDAGLPGMGQWDRYAGVVARKKAAVWAFPVLVPRLELAIKPHFMRLPWPAVSLCNIRQVTAML